MNFSKKQNEFLNSVLKGNNIFLTGKAGTGKSSVVRTAMQKLRDKGKNVVALAPTGIAANNIGGQTIHSLFSLNPFGVMSFEECNYLKPEKRRLLDKIDVIFIDEVSMFRPDIFDGINWTLIKNGCRRITEMQIVLIGDLKQLKSPIDDNTRSILRQTYSGDEFFHAKIYSNLDFKIIELDEIMRQNDQEFIEALNLVRNGSKSEYFRQFANNKPQGIILAPHNATVQKYNIEGLKNLPGKEIVFDAIIEGNAKASDFNLETKVVVKNGAKIMYLVNSRENNLVNGTLGIFTVIDGKYFIDVKGVQYALEQYTATKKQYVLNDAQDKLEMQEIGSITQYPIKLAYALTIHKSQGLTFEQVTIDLSRACFEQGQMYTALSRVTSPNGLTIITK